MHKSSVCGLFGRSAGENPSLSAFLQNKPFDQHVEGLSHCGHESCAVERAVRAHDFPDSPLGGVIRHNPQLRKDLRELKRFNSEFGVLVVRAVEDIVRQLDGREPIRTLPTRRT